MAYVYDNKTYRNLQQQVKENMDDIARLQSLKLVGLDVAHIVDTEEDLADITAEQGMVVAVGTEQPYKLFVYNDSSWVDFGEFPKAGPQGEQGPQGQVGNPGPRGLTGAAGPRGYTGAPGPAGSPGPQGARGPQGPKGDKGDRGVVDAYAADAESITAVGQAYVDENGYLQVCTSLSPLTFEQGASVKGPKGDTGEQGPQGIQGEQGAQGPTGATGPQGARGPQGEQGIRGPQGEQGIQGPQGPTGATGPEGPQGPKGDTGAQGPTGPTGPQGPKGDPGLTASVEVNGQVYTTDSTGKITLPDYPDEVAWGNIQGTLSDQTDLQSALDAKANNSALTQAVSDLEDEIGTKQDIILDLANIRSGAAAGATAVQPAAIANMVTTDTDQTITGYKAIYNGMLFDYENNHTIEINPGYDNSPIKIELEDYDDTADLYKNKLVFNDNDGKTTTYGNGSIKRLPVVAGTELTFTLPSSSGTLALQSEIPTTMAWSDITGKPTFATVATSGSYNDLSDKPTIPIIGNATLTIQKNGTSVGTFNANATTNKSINITVPTATSELTNDSGFITSSAIPTNYVTTDTQQTINGAKTFSSAVNLGNQTNIIGGTYESFFNLKDSTNTNYLGRIIASSTELKLSQGSSGGISLSKDTNTGRVHLLPTNNGRQNLGSDSTRWNDLYLAGNLTDGTNTIAVANIADKTNSETWTFEVDDGQGGTTTVTKTVVLE